MIAQDTITVIRTYWQALQHPGPTSLQTMLGLMDEHIEWEVVPLGLKRHGQDEMRQVTYDQATLMRQLVVTTTAVIPDH